jgi:hypothetical protein
MTTLSHALAHTLDATLGAIKADVNKPYEKVLFRSRLEESQPRSACKSGFDGKARAALNVFTRQAKHFSARSHRPLTGVVRVDSFRDRIGV